LPHASPPSLRAPRHDAVAGFAGEALKNVPTFLDFEKPIAELEGKIEELRHLSDGGGLNIADEVVRLQEKADRLLKTTYAKLTPWQKVQVARHPERPHALDYIDGLFTDYQPLAGDRAYAEDPAIVGGFARFAARSLVVIGTEKGHDTESRLKHNFGMARPEGYRKAQRLMRLAERFRLPIVTLVDTSGAFPGKDAEERGQAEAIARAIETCLDVRTPVVSMIIGEGGSGGAIALATANIVLMMEHAIYSVISPEGCASILWRSADLAKDAAEALKITAQDLLALGVIDAIVPEPLGGAHRNREQTMSAAKDALDRALRELSPMDGSVLRQKRREKFLAIGKIGLG
jgi:acetyl-CoA carboxylase carboxyl transferase subunit alpha